MRGIERLFREVMLFIYISHLIRQNCQNCPLVVSGFCTCVTQLANHQILQGRRRSIQFQNLTIFNFFLIIFYILINLSMLYLGYFFWKQNNWILIAK